MTTFGMTQEDRTRLRTATILAVGFYLVLFLAMLGIKAPTGGSSAPAGGATIAVEFEGNPQQLSVSHGEGASGSAAGRLSTEPSGASAGASLASSGGAQRVPVNPFALPPGIDLSGDVVAASSGALEANRVTYGSQSAPAASPRRTASPSEIQGRDLAASVQSAQASGGFGANSAVAQSSQTRAPSGGAGGGAPFMAEGVAPAATSGTAGAEVPASGGSSIAGGGAAAAASGAGASAAGPNVFDQATLAFALGQQSAGYAGNSGSGGGGSGSGRQAAGGGSADGASAGGGSGRLSAPGAIGEGGFPIHWTTPGGRQPQSEPPPLDLSKYAKYLPPRAVVWVHFEVSPSGYVTPLQLEGSSGNTVVDSLLLGWMGKWTFSPVSGTQMAQGRLKYIIQATTAR